ncbi:unnamed protein product [Rotaria sp. Silwood2]|nr:unnamed protein product [Rotaria sp. Silwood2]CAF2569718.1 unnamed protein product [Rotaria sp. Silwood2]CAF2963534.1 unnamed protein product [Rotaria sp. Silwood2]CAF3931204.1 unnamed protein product [Rotaria sp. Silwood2]CAF3961036.1 unnamed protein product [Rotaria sp. Silwood2]
MATAGNTFSSYDHTIPSMSDDSTTLSTQNHRPFTNNTNPSHPRPGQHLDDADLLAWKRQYANIGLREKNTMSNSADDLSQLVDHIPYQFEVFDQDYNDMDDDEIHFDNGNSYDYEAAIQERLKKINEEFEHDETPSELKHRQRVSFDAVVKAVDITQDPQEYENIDSLAKPSISPVAEEPSISADNSQDENNSLEYTVPLNDTQPKEGPTLLQQLKAMQFHGISPVGDRWSSTNSNKTNGSSTREEDLSSLKLKSNNNTDMNDTSDMTTNSSSSSKKSMIVSINGGFELQNEDDYIAKDSTERRRHEFGDDHDDDDDDKDKKASIENRKLKFVPTPPTEAKQPQDPLKSQTPSRPYPSLTRPKSSDSGKRTINSNSTTSNSMSDNKNKSTTNNERRATSAGVSRSLEPSNIRLLNTLAYEQRCQRAAEKKQAELREEQRKKKETEEKRKIELAEAQKRFQEWVRDKDAERKRFNEEKRMENEERETRRIKCEKELEELREKKYKEWIQRKNREVMITNEFKKLQAEDEEKTAPDGSSSSIHSANQRGDHRAFHRWLRRKYEQSKEEKRQLRLEARRLRRLQRRSIKRFRLQQDLQLAKSFGYS